jgi:D-sedoheptulose 7-phosphate isomerase
MSIEKIRKMLFESAEVKTKTAELLSDDILTVAKLCAKALRDGKKLLLCGNGGSAADSQHLATELIVRLSGNFERPPLKAIALTTDSSILTAGANDYGFENIFTRQVEALADNGDILIAISTSGNSLNIINAVESAKNKNAVTIGFLGGDGGGLKTLVDYSLIVPSNDTARIQECHITIGHIIISIIEDILFSKE